MKLKYLLKFCMIAFMFILPLGVMAQTIKGKVTDSSGEGLPYMNVVEKGNTSNGIVSDDNGEFSIIVKSLPASLVVSSMGFETKIVTVANSSFLTIVVNENNALDEVVVTGSRTPVRSNTKSPLPIDIVSAKDLVNEYSFIWVVIFISLGLIILILDYIRPWNSHYLKYIK